MTRRLTGRGVAGHGLGRPAVSYQVSLIRTHFTGGEAFQGRNGLVDGFPTAVSGDEFMERHGR